MRTRWTTARVLAAAVVLLLGAGTAHHWAHLSRAGQTARYRPPAIPLEELPASIGSFTQVQDLQLGAEVLQVAGVDSFVYREYAASGVARPISLYVGYWGYQNTGTGHGPEVCYPAAGWQPEGSPEQRVIRFQNAKRIDTEAVVALHHFVRTEPEGVARVAVGFVAVVDGRFRASSRGTFLHRPPTTANGGFLAQTIVSTFMTQSDDPVADGHIVDFLEPLLPHVSRCLFGDGPTSDKTAGPGQAEGRHERRE